MLCSTYFTELFLTRSSTRPRLLFVLEQDIDWLFFSSAQPQNPYEKSSLVVATDFHMKLSKDNCSYASGLIYLCNMWNIKDDHTVAGAICNPSTGQYTILPLPEGLDLGTFERSKSYLGFDPIDKQFKWLFLSTIRDDIACNDIVSNETVHHIATLGTGKTIRWRNIQCPFSHELLHEGICINGVLYYQAEISEGLTDQVIVCFDVRSETFKFVDAECCGSWLDGCIYSLINYKGKVCVIGLDYYGRYVEFPLKLRMWVLEDVEKQKWSKRFYTLQDENGVVNVKGCLCVASALTATGEIVLYMEIYKSKEPFYVFYFDPERNTLHSVEIQGFKEKDSHVYAFVDHVEDLNFSIMKKTTATSTSISPPEQKA